MRDLKSKPLTSESSLFLFFFFSFSSIFRSGPSFVGRLTEERTTRALLSSLFVGHLPGERARATRATTHKEFEPKNQKFADSP